MLFDVKNGRKKLAYDQSLGDAPQILRLRFTDGEMTEIVDDRHARISQRRLQDDIELLG